MLDLGTPESKSPSPDKTAAHASPSGGGQRSTPPLRASPTLTGGGDTDAVLRCGESQLDDRTAHQARGTKSLSDQEKTEVRAQAVSREPPQRPEITQITCTATAVGGKTTVVEFDTKAL